MTNYHTSVEMAYEATFLQYGEKRLKSIYISMLKLSRVLPPSKFGVYGLTIPPQLL